MPKIQTVEAEINPNQTMQVRPQSGDGITSGLMSLSRDIVGAGQKIERFEQMQDASEGDADLSDITTEYKLQIANAKNVDDLSGQRKDALDARYQEKLQAASAKMRTQFGKQRLESQAAETFNSLQLHADAKYAGLVGIKIKDEFKKFSDNKELDVQMTPTHPQVYSEAVAAIKNKAKETLGDEGIPLAYETVTKLADSNFNAILGTAGGQYALDRVLGKEVTKDGKTTIEGYRYADSGLDRNKLIAEAKQDIRARQIEADRLKAKREDNKKEVYNQIHDKFTGLIAENKLTYQDIRESALPSFGQGSKDTWFGILANPNSMTNPAAYDDLFTRIHANDDDPKKMWDDNEIIEARAAKKISDQQMNFLRSEFKDTKTQDGRDRSEAYKRAKEIGNQAFVSAGISGKDLQGVDVRNKYMYLLKKEVTERIKQGESFYDLMGDPTSPKYVPTKIIGTLRKSMIQIQQDNMDLAFKKSAAAPTATPAPQNSYESMPNEIEKEYGGKKYKFIKTPKGYVRKP